MVSTDGPFGFGRLTIDTAIAYGEPFASATRWPALRRRTGYGWTGSKSRRVKEQLPAPPTSGWDGTYSFNADGRRIAVETVAAVAYPQAPLSGQLQFTASGVGAFDSPPV